MLSLAASTCLKRQSPPPISKFRRKTAMSALTIGGSALVSIIVLAGFGVPIGVAIGMTAAIGIWMSSGYTMMLVNMQSLPYATAAEYAFIVVPMFVLMGNLAAAAGMIESMFEAAAKWLGRVRGGLYIAVTLASAGFAAISGSTVVNAAVFTKMVLPQMLRLGYNKQISSGCIAAAGTFAVMIPPSLAFVLYGIMTGESVGKLFMAGVVPGIMTAVIYVFAIKFMVKLKPEWAPPPTQQYTRREKLLALKPLWAIGLLIGIVLGGIYSGYVPPSAAGAIGAIGALLIAIAQRRMTPTKFWECVTQSAIMASSLFFIVISGFLFSRFMISSGFVPELTAMVSGSGIGKWEFLAIMVVMYFILGMFIDGASMAVVTLPFVYPVAQTLGIDGIWFGVLFVKLVEIGAITPPVGMNLFAVVAASEGRMKLIDVIKGIWPFVILEVLILAILLAFPALSLWLPNSMF
ncbi:MAG: TRAP transporter large permease [Bosea sp. (in: a-proteobacteria)]